MANSNPQYKATVISEASEKLAPTEKGSIRVLHLVRLEDGPGKGLEVTATRTILNSYGKTKAGVKPGDKITVFHEQVESTSNPGTMMNFFQISTGQGASQDEINNAFASVSVEATQEQVV